METPTGRASDPNEPPRVRQLSAPELKAMMDAGIPLLLVDVRTEEERAVAKIDGSRLLDQEYYNHLLGLDRATRSLRGWEIVRQRNRCSRLLQCDTISIKPRRLPDGAKKNDPKSKVRFAPQ